MLEQSLPNMMEPHHAAFEVEPYQFQVTSHFRIIPSILVNGSFNSESACAVNVQLIKADPMNVCGWKVGKHL